MFSHNSKDPTNGNKNSVPEGKTVKYFGLSADKKMPHPNEGLVLVVAVLGSNLSLKMPLQREEDKSEKRRNQGKLQ